MTEKRPLHKFLLFVALYWLSELVYKVEHMLGTAPDLDSLYCNYAGTLLSEWMLAFVTHSPDDYEFYEDRISIFKAFMYGCNPVRAAEAITANRNVVLYCLRYNDGIV